MIRYERKKEHRGLKYETKKDALSVTLNFCHEKNNRKNQNAAISNRKCFLHFWILLQWNWWLLSISIELINEIIILPKWSKYFAEAEWWWKLWGLFCKCHFIKSCEQNILVNFVCLHTTFLTGEKTSFPTLLFQLFSERRFLNFPTQTLLSR